MPHFTYKGSKLYYREIGSGEPLLLLHGNAASSKMFQPLLPLYTTHCRCILLDFLGNGQSERVERFSPDMWLDEAFQAIALVEHLDIGKVHLIGTSGGAWAAVNAGLERPDLFHTIVADSFDGRTLDEDFSGNLLDERKDAQKQLLSRLFYRWCHGKDWNRVVDLDTQALLQCAAARTTLFATPLHTLQVPLLLMGSKEDGSCRKNLAEEYAQLASIIPHVGTLIFEKGGHPAIVSNAKKAAAAIRAFISQPNTY